MGVGVGLLLRSRISLSTVRGVSGGCGAVGHLGEVIIIDQSTSDVHDAAVFLEMIYFVW